MNQPWEKQWEEEEEIGRGGQGIVTKLVSRSDPSRRAVLKRIVERWRTDSQAKERLQKEADTLLKLHDRGAKVPEVYDSSLKHPDSEPFLIMEFIEGTLFDKWLKEKAPVNPSDAGLITKGIAKTISLCHTIDIGHRDLKPSNIILRGGQLSKPYVLDFGISFDAQQTYALTQEGEIFRNEFITLPECQDLEGGHRDLRSDITAIAGIFFTCLTAKPPILLRDAHELAPHQRHEKLLIAAANTKQQGERLTWLFDKAFAYRVSDRFSSIEAFMQELDKITEDRADEVFNLYEEYSNLEQVMQSSNREVQLGEMRKGYQKAFQRIAQKMQNSLNEIQRRGGSASLSSLQSNQLLHTELPEVSGTPLNGRDIHAYHVTRSHVNGSAVVLIAPYAVEMQTHLYIASYVSKSQGIQHPTSSLNWTKTVVMDSGSEPISDAKRDIVTEAIEQSLARELRNLTRTAS